MEHFGLVVFYILLISISELPKFTKADAYVKSCTKREDEVKHIYHALSRIGPNSKYLHGYSSNWQGLGNYFDHVEKFCESADLELASMESAYELKVLEKYMRRINYNSPSSFWVDGTDAVVEGKWISTVTKTLIQFQNFYALAPNDQAVDPNSKADNILLRWSKDTLRSKSGLVMHDIEGNERTKVPAKSVFCQYATWTTCYQNSDEEKAKQSTPDTLELLGDTDNNKFYVSHKQKSKKQAQKFCKSKSKYLFNIALSSIEESNQLHDLVTKWLLKKEFNGNSNGFILDTANTKLFRKDYKLSNWQWVENDIADQKEDVNIKEKKGLKRNFGKCLVAGALYKSKKYFSLARTSCDLPYWVICSDKATNPNPGPDPGPGPGPEPEPTEDPGDITTIKPGPDGGGDEYYKKNDVYLWEVIAV